MTTKSNRYFDILYRKYTYIIWQLPHRKPLHWRHSVGVSPVRLRIHWATELVVGTLNLEKERKLQYSFHFRSLSYFCLSAFTSFPYWLFTITSLQHMSTDTSTYTDTDTRLCTQIQRRSTNTITGTDMETDMGSRTWTRTRTRFHGRAHIACHQLVAGCSKMWKYSPEFLT